MPGYVIHIAIANEYIRRNKSIENKKELIDGVLAPDSVTDKSLTHYGEYSSRPNLREYLIQNELTTDYKKGYFLHLLTDYLFYNYYIVKPKGVTFYQDYDRTNKELIEKYDVHLPEELKKYANISSDLEPEILKLDLLENMIDEISSVNLEKAAKEIKNNNYIMIANKKIETNIFKRV